MSNLHAARSLSGLLIVAVLAALPARADQLTLKNGDRVSGRVVKKDGDTLTFKSDLMGTITLKWADVTNLASDQPLWVIPKGAEKAVSGTVQTAADQLAVTTQQGTTHVPLTSVQTIRNADEQAVFDRYLHPPLTDLWKGFVDIGVAGSRGNSRTTTFTTAFNASRETANDKIRLHLNQIFARGVIDGQAADTANAIRGGWAYDRRVDGARWFLNVFNDYEHDALQSLDLRWVSGGGLGFHAYKSDRGQLDLLAGGSYDHERFGVALKPPESGNTRNFGEAFWGDEFNWKLSRIVGLKQRYRMFHNLSQLGEYRLNFDFSTDAKINRWLSWQITFSDLYVTNPPPDRKRTDILLTSGIRISFAQ